MIFNNKGLSSGLTAITVALFLFAMVSAIVIPIKSHWDAAIQNLPDDVADDYTKQQIADNTTQLAWLDKMFVVFLVVLLASYLISSFTLPAKNAWIFLIFTAFIILVTFIAMVLSNSWSYMLTDPFFSGVTDAIPITDFMLRNFPYFVFLTGIVGGVVFYSRSKEDFNGGGDMGGGVPPMTPDFGGEFN